MIHRQKQQVVKERKIDRQIIGPYNHNPEPRICSRHPPSLGSQYKYIDIKVSTLGKGQIIGFNDHLHQRPYSTSVKCISCTGKVLMIKAEDFKVKMASN